MGPQRTSREASWTSATTHQTARAVLLRLGDSANAPDHLRRPVLHGRVHPAPQGGRLSVRPGGLDCLEAHRDRGDHAGHGEPSHHRRVSRSRCPGARGIIRAAELLGIAIPPVLRPPAASNRSAPAASAWSWWRASASPLASCITACTEGMVVHTQLNLRGRGQGRSRGLNGVAAHQPTRSTARCCDKGRRVPRCRTRPCPTAGGRPGSPEEKRTFAKPGADLHPGAARPRALHLLHQVHQDFRGDRRRMRSSSSSGAAPAQFIAPPRASRFNLLLLRQHRAGVPVRRA